MLGAISHRAQRGRPRQQAPPAKATIHHGFGCWKGHMHGKAVMARKALSSIGWWQAGFIADAAIAIQAIDTPTAPTCRCPSASGNAFQCNPSRIVGVDQQQVMCQIRMSRSGNVRRWSDRRESVVSVNPCARMAARATISHFVRSRSCRRAEGARHNAFPKNPRRIAAIDMPDRLCDLPQAIDLGLHSLATCRISPTRQCQE